MIYPTVQPAKSDSDGIFCLQTFRDCKSIDYLCITQVIYRFLLAQDECTS